MRELPLRIPLLWIALFASGVGMACSIRKDEKDVGRAEIPAASVNTSGKPSNSGDGRELAVGGTSANLNYSGDRESFLRNPAPEVWLFDENTGEKFVLSTDARQIIHKQWTDSLSNRYRGEIEATNGQEYADSLRALFVSSTTAETKLQKIPVKIHGTSRQLYYEEVGGIIMHLSQEAVRLIEEEKKKATH